MTFQEFLAFEIFSFNNFSFSVSNVLAFIVVIVITTLVRVVLKRVIMNAKKGEVEEYKKYSVYRLTSYVLWTIGLVLGLEAAGISVTILLAGSAALLVGVGLGLQHTFNDLVSGLILLFEGSIKLNDVVVVDGQYGQIVEIGLRTSKIETRDNIIMIIPNSKFITENVTNWSYNNKTTRFFVNVSVAYGSDLELVKKILLEVSKGNDNILKDPKPVVEFNNFGDSGLYFNLYFWTNHAFESKMIQSSLRFEIDKRFRENNISIPFPQVDLHIKSGYKE
jgi:small-conductance mechanosensitive channel